MTGVQSVLFLLLFAARVDKQVSRFSIPVLILCT